MNPQLRSFLLSFVTVGIILSTAIAIIAYGRGYRFDFTNRALNPTGLVVVQSDPSGAQILVDGVLKSATQTTLTLSPGWYDITITKEGFQPWKKNVKVQGEIVNKIDALLLPVNPSLTALTVSGVVSPILSPDGSKLAYVIPDQPQATISGALSPTRPGIWILDLIDKPLGLNRDARQITQSNGINFENAQLHWSPDSKQLLVTVPTGSAYLLETDRLNDPPRIVNINTIQTIWQDIKTQRLQEQFATIPEEFIAFASESARILALSPDETKILYEATASATLPAVIVPPLIGTNSSEEVRSTRQDHVYVYDIKEDLNFELGATGMFRAIPLPTPTRAPGARNTAPVLVQDPMLSIRWLPSSRHLLYVTEDTIRIMDYDASNQKTAYAGPFWDSFAVPWASGGKIVILTNFNNQASKANNLYVVNLR